MLSQIFSSDFPGLILQLLSFLGSVGDFLAGLVQAGFALAGLQLPDYVIKVISIAVAGLLVWKFGGSFGKVVFIVGVLIITMLLLSLVL